MISPLAYIDPSAVIGNNVSIHPFAYIDKNVVIGDDCEIMPHASLMSGTRMGNGNKIYQGAVVAAVPQDFFFQGDDTQAIIGDNNVIRENVVINRGTFSGGSTTIGNNNFLHEGVHISHDTKVYDNCVIGFGSKISGNCILEDSVIFGGGILMSQGSRVGTWSMVKTGSRFNKDIPPYIVAAKEPIAYYGVNAKVLAHNNFTEKILNHIAHTYRLLYHSNNSLDDSISKIKEQVPMNEEIENIIRFLETSKVGIIR